MSAYVLDEQCFDLIYTVLEIKGVTRDGRNWFEAVKEQLVNLEGTGYYTRNDEVHTAMSLTREFQFANTSAVSYRYNDDPEFLRVPRSDPRYYSVTLPEFWGVLACLRYQCHEGTVEMTDAYKRLVRLMTAVSTEIVRDMEAVCWGMPDRLDAMCANKVGF